MVNLLTNNVSRETFNCEGFKMEVFLNCIWAFLVGGLICLIGQILIDYTKLTPARILVSYVVAGVILTAIGIYDPIVKFAGAGATVPLTGFGYSLAMGVKEAIGKYGFMGVLAGGFTATSAGIATAVVSGYLMSLLFKPGDKS